MDNKMTEDQWYDLNPVKNPLVRLRNSMLILGITGDSLFARIREDLDRGLTREARTHLNFVDVMVQPNNQLPKP